MITLNNYCGNFTCNRKATYYGTIIIKEKDQRTNKEIEYEHTGYFCNFHKPEQGKFVKA